MGHVEAHRPVPDGGLGPVAVLDLGSRGLAIAGGDRDQVAADRALEPDRRVETDDPAVIDDRDPRVAVLGLVHVVGREEDGQSLGLAAAFRR